MYKVEIDTLEELLENKNILELKKVLSKMMLQDIADFIETIDEKDTMLVVFRLLSKDVAAQVFSYLESDVQEEIISAISSSEICTLSRELYTDDFVDFLEEMPENLVKKILRNTDSETRKIVNKFLKYKEDSAGAVMTSEFISFKEDSTVLMALRRLKKEAADMETINICYVNNSNGKLVGVTTLVDLVLANPEVKLKEIMDEKVINVSTAEDQELVARKFEEYDLLAMPVVDNEQRLVGIITVDDIIDIMKEEATEDMAKMAGMEPAENPYFRTTPLELARNRIVWLLLLMISSMITGSILENYEVAFAAIPILVTFIPMITGTGGNCGAQSSTTIIRGMSVGEVSPKDTLKVLWKELRVSLLVGIALSAVNFIRIMIVSPGQMGVAIVVSIALMLTVILSKLVGCVLPIGAKMLKLDPAIMAAPLITTIVDAVSLIVYFNLAILLLNIQM